MPERQYVFSHGDHLSPSQITDYLACPACWKMTRLDRLPRKQSISLPIGGAIHKAVERWRQAMLAGGPNDLPLDEFTEVAVEHFDQSLQVDKETGSELLIDLGDYGSTGEAKDHTVELTRFILPEIAKLDIARGLIAIELDLDQFDNPWPFPMRGRVDVLYGPAPDLCDKGADLKTSSRQAAPDFMTAIQLGIYRSFLPVSWFADVAAKTIHPSFQTYVLSEEGDVFVRGIVLEVADRICRGDFPPRPNRRCKFPHGNPTFSIAVSWPEATSD